MKRTEFLITCSTVCLGGLGLSVMAGGCSSANYFAKHELNNRRIRVSKTEFDGIKNEVPFKRDYVLIKNELLQFPICVYRFSDDSYVALYLKCTHQGCEVEPQRDFLVCPCHGSEYNNRGKVINPPAEHDLQKYEVSLEENFITITL